MKNTYVNNELEAQLPKANLFKIRFHSPYWWRQLFKWILRKRNRFGYRIQRPKFYITSRGANYQSWWFGPINLTVRKRWLLISAHGLYPQLFRGK